MYKKNRAGGTAQLIGALVALAEDACSVPSISMVVCSIHNCRSGDLMLFSDLQGRRIVHRHIST